MGSLALTGSFTTFENQSIEVREKQLLSWKLSVIPTYRKVYDSLVKLGVAMYLRNSPTVYKVMNFKAVNAATPEEGHFDFKFLSASEATEVSLDAIIVGSGSGGGVAAKALSEAGMKVLVLERGQHVDHSGTYTEAYALENMYDRAALMTNDGGGIGLVQASVFGGGSTVNWAASLQTPAAVRADWAKTFGLPYFTTPEFQGDLDYVCDVMGVSPPTVQNTQNSLLMEGARRLGYQHAAVPQNNGGGHHACGHDCANSCRSGGKKGGVHTWLADASRAGALFLTRADVRRVDFDNRVAVGVTLNVDGQELSIKAPRIIVAGGSIHTPALLKRSRVPNPRVGASIYLHPTNYVYGIFDDDTHPTEGNILTSVVGEYANISPGGYGVRVETGIMQPIIAMTLLQWAGGQEHKGRLANHSKMVGLIAISRDKDSGRVKLDKEGEPEVYYTVSAHDANSVKTGTVAAAECLRAVGAKEIIVGGRGVPAWKKGEDWDSWTGQIMDTAPGCYGSAHQMGSCRMSSRPADGACDPDGKLYGVQGVWVADASVLPSSSGVNPMVSTMAVANKVARGIVEGWKEGGVPVLTARL